MVSELARGFELLAPAYVPFEPRTAELRELRADIQHHLRQLLAGPGELLHAQLAGALPPGADAENALLYNINQGGSAMAAATRHGLRFEVDPEPLPTGGVRYRYQLAPTDGGFAGQRLVRRLETLTPTRLGREAPRCARVWWALKQGDLDVGDGPLRAGERFAVRLDVEGPADSLRPEAMKALLDGVVCALQAHTDSSSLAEPARRIAAALGQPTNAVSAALRGADQAVLGLRRRLVHPWGASVQWSPDDHLCVAGELRYARAAEWRLAGDVLTAQRSG